MFVGRKLGEFVVTGPYRYLRNPMYGLGQAQVYAMAIYWNSLYGIIFGAINQLLVYLFYFTVERPFVNRTYLGRQ
jgi:protein-S-isoprenylcysteine O-methyltransferase Ste14